VTWPADIGPRLDIGLGHSIVYFRWAPEDLPENRARYGYPLPDVPRAGCCVYHTNKNDGVSPCVGATPFDLPELRLAELSPGHSWQVLNWEPLTLSPSVLCGHCGDHGFIQNGKWVPA